MRIVSLAGFLIMVISGCSSPAAFEYRDLKNIKVENWQSNQSKVTMQLVYYNPNNYGVNLKNVKCDIAIDSVFIGSFNLDTMMHIEKKSEFTLPATMNVDLRKLYSNALNIFFGNEVMIQAKGTSKVGKGGIYVTVPFTYEGKHRLSIN